jgi:hypothetical protein
MIDPRRRTIYDFNVDKLSKLAIENRAMLKKPSATERRKPEKEDVEKVEAVEAAE